MSSSQVDLVANPSPHVSTYRWTLNAVGQLTRKNKMTSLPFWMPNHITKKHQFRLVLIRGMVMKGHPDDDPIALMMELIPPPIGDNVSFPGGCVVTASVVNRVHEGRAHNIEATETVEITPDNLQVFFLDLIPASVFRNPEFAEGEGPSLLLELTIQVGVNVAIERVNQTVSSMWSKLSTSVTKLVERASRALDETREEFVVQEPVREPQRLPWEDVPKKWEDRKEEWRHLVSKLIVEDEGTFRYGPDRGFSKDEKALLVQCGLNQRLITNAHAVFNYDRDVHEGLLSIPEIRQQRYNLVPGRIKEEVFWANYFWKVTALSFCSNEEQVRLLLTVLNAPPAVQPRDMSSVRSVDEETVLSHVSDAQEAADMLIEYLTDEDPGGDILIEAAADACEGHAKQLEGYFKRSDLSETTLKIISVSLKHIRERLAVYKARDIKRVLAEQETPAGLYNVHRECNSRQDEAADIGGQKNEFSTQQGSSTKPAPVEEGPGEPDDMVSSSLAGTTDQRTKGPIAEAEVSPAVVTAAEQSVKQSSVALDFPKMPWEEEDEQD
uniref:BSD domain-containing protein n=1 Tax=Trypanosoma congolense (strain IL3000) TaxID=1068625 RepID=G0UTK1_TRYCI|nr:conserved hypothetical protein [Trypanosoma congolense IL3000]